MCFDSQIQTLASRRLTDNHSDVLSFIHPTSPLPQAVLLLHQQRDILWVDSSSYSQYLLQSLRGPPLPSTTDPDAKQFILSSLKYLFAAKLCSPQLVALLMALAANCDTEIGYSTACPPPLFPSASLHLRHPFLPACRNVIHRYLKGCGLSDDHGYFAELLSSWPLPSDEDGYGSCSEWIGEWATRMETTKQSKCVTFLTDIFNLVSCQHLLCMLCMCMCLCLCRKTQRSTTVLGKRQTTRGKKDAAEERARG